MTLGLVTAMWKRPALTKAFMEHWARLEVPGVDWVRVAVISPEDDTLFPRPLARTRPTIPDVDGWEFALSPNEPLSDKFNAGFRALRAFDVDVAIVVGSDDFATTDFVEALLRKHRSGAHFVVPSGLYALCADTGEACFMDRPHIGTGRLLSRSLLDKLGWQPYPAAQNYVNGNMCQRIAWASSDDKRQRGTKRYPAAPDPVFRRHHILTRESGLLVDVKSSGSKNTYRRIARNASSSAVCPSVITSQIPALEAFIKTYQNEVRL